MNYVKKQVKYCIIGLCIFVCSITLICIYTFSRQHVLMQIYPPTTTAMYDASIHMIKDLKIDESWIKQSHLLVSMFLTSAERILMFSCEENRQDEVIESAHDYVDALKKTFKNSDQLTYIQNYEEYVKDNYYILVISEDAKSILTFIKAALA